MASLRYPDTGTRMVVRSDGAPARNAVGLYYEDPAGTIPAEIYADSNGTRGALVASSSLTTDVYGQQPDYWGPGDGQDRLWVSFDGGPLVPVDADYNARIDAAVSGGETPAGAQAKADAAQAAAISAAATDATTKAAAAQAAAVSTAAADATTKASAAQAAAVAASLPRAGGSVTGRLGVGTAADANIRVSVAQAADSSGVWSLNTTAGGNSNSAHVRGDSVTPASLLLAGRVTGDTTSRVLTEVGGVQRWGTGSAGTDTVLYRASAGHLHTEGQLSANGGKLTPSTWFNVCEYGAVGDDATDCTTAIQAAIDAVPDQGGTVYIPAGIYRTHAPINVRGALTIVGDGDGATVIAPLHVGSTLVGVDVDRLTIRGVWIEGTASTGGTGIALTLGSAPHTGYVNLSDVTVATVPGDGVAIENPIVSVFNRVVVQTCGGWGVNLHGQPGGASGTSVSLNGCYANACTSGGFRLFKMSYCALTGCAADSNAIGYLLDQAFNVTLNGCGGEGNLTNTVKVAGGYGNALRSIFVYANHGVGVWLTSSASAVVIEQAVDVEPHVAATNFLKVDSGCRAALLACNNTSPNSLATGTTSVLTDGGGNLDITGALAAGGSLTIAGDGVLSRPAPYALRAENNFQVGSTFAHQGANAGFYGAAPVAQPVVTGAKGGNAALTSLIQKLAAIGLIADSTS